MLKGLLPYIRPNTFYFQKKMFCNVFLNIINENSQEFYDLFRRYEPLPYEPKSNLVGN